MNAKSKILALAVLAAGYGFLYWTFTTAFFATQDIEPGYRYLIVLLAVPMFLAAHGIAFVRWRNPKGKTKGAIGSHNLVGRHTALEVFLTWLAVSSVLLSLYYIAPADDLRDWYPRFFLILTVVFAATLDRALVFVCGMMPFMLTLSGLAFWTFDRGSLVSWNPSLEPIGAAALLLLDFAVFIWALRLARRSGVFGMPLYHSNGSLARLGGWISGVIATTQCDNADAGYLVQLACIGKRCGDGPSEVLWTGETRVAGEPSQQRRGQIDIPVQIRLPRTDQAVAGLEDPDSRWMLRVQAALPEANFRATFEVPVLAGDRRDSTATTGAMRHADPMRPKSYATAAKPGTTKFRFSELWNSSSELVAGAACLFWVQLIWLTTREPLDWAGWAMFGVGLVVLSRVIAPWLVKTTVVIGEATLQVTHERLFLRTRRSVLKTAVRRILVERGKVRTGAAASLGYYRLIVECDNQHRIEVGRHLRDRATAEQAALEIEAAICQAPVAVQPPAEQPASVRERFEARPQAREAEADVTPVVPIPVRETAAAEPTAPLLPRPGQLVAFRLPDAPEPEFHPLDEAALELDNIPEPLFVTESA